MPEAGSASRPFSAADRPRRRLLRELGFLYGTLVGLAWGLPWSTGRIVREGDIIVLSGLPKWAYRRGGTTIGRVYLTGNNVGERVLVHEAVHVEQWRRLGMWFPLLYWLAGADPLHNRFEIEAGLEDGGYLPRRRPPRRTASGTGTPASPAASSTPGTDSPPA